jgi:SAM-dependent methyltransferase
VRRFDADYLRDTRRGMWADRSALADLALSSRERVLDVGCGTGEFTRVLAAESAGSVWGVDADPSLLSVARREDGPDATGEDRAGDDRSPEDPPGEGGSDRAVAGYLAGDATALPLRTGAVDLAVCQALLVNLPDPVRAVAELRRVSSELVAAVEPDNAAVSVESTVDAEPALEARARRAYLAGVDTDAGLGAVPDRLREAGLAVVGVRRYDHVRTVAPPYAERDLRAARRKATGAGLDADRETVLAGGLSPEGYDRLREEWREMGRAVVAAMADGDYRRTETVPFYVTVGRVEG